MDQRDLIDDSDSTGTLVSAPFPAVPVRTDPAPVAFDKVLAWAGAIVPVRDAVDRRIIEQVRRCRGRIIDTQWEVGGWPTYRKEGSVPEDRDSDGMPDFWERRRGLNPVDPTDAGIDMDGNGYCELEDYLNGLVEQKRARINHGQSRHE